MAVCFEMHNKIANDELRDAVRNFTKALFTSKSLKKCQGTGENVISFMPTLKIAVLSSTDVHGTHT
jgi:hypothetical protein